MDYLNLENWEIIRDIIGMMICLVSILCLVKNKKEFKGYFLGELLKEEITDLGQQRKSFKIKKQKNNHKGKYSPKNSKKAGSNAKSLHRPEKLQQHRKLKIVPQVNPNQKNPQRSQIDEITRDVSNQYERIKYLAHSGLTEADIQKRLGIPRAEIDLVLKFDRLSKLKRNYKPDFIRDAVNS